MSRRYQLERKLKTKRKRCECTANEIPANCYINPSKIKYEVEYQEYVPSINSGFRRIIKLEKRKLDYEQEESTR